MSILPTSTAPIALLVQCSSLEEAGVAWNAIQAFRTGAEAPADGGDLPADPTLGLAARIEKALHGAPLNQPKQIVLTMLRDGVPDAWVAYPDMQAALTAEGLTPERAAAALRDLSWQMKEFLLPDDTASFPRKIEVMAERTRAGGVYRYRLTPAGRIAVTNFLKHIQQ